MKVYLTYECIEVRHYSDNHFSKAREKEGIEEEHMPNNLAFISCDKATYE